MKKIIEIPEDSELREAIILYLKHNPGYKASKNKSTEFPFLMKQDGTPMTVVNAITRVLNKVFGKKIGVSMLRHSYLSKKYGGSLTSREEDADMMAHSISEQGKYIRTDDSEEE
jgi:integrase